LDNSAADWRRCARASPISWSSCAVRAAAHRARRRATVRCAHGDRRGESRSDSCKRTLAVFSGKDAGLQRPDAGGFRRVHQRRASKQAPHALSPHRDGDVDADLGDASIDCPRRVRRQRSPADDLPRRIAGDQAARGQVLAIPRFPIRRASARRWPVRWRCLRDRWRALAASRRDAACR
jgi:hypothetical protein